MSSSLLLPITVVLLTIILWGIYTYNKLIARQNKLEQCESGISVALKQRSDMIPALVSSVKGYVGYENNLLKKITELRSLAAETMRKEEKQGLDTALSQELSKLPILVEKYPLLKADTQFLKLENSIEEVEDRLQAIRRTYNAAAISYNNTIRMFPSNIVASLAKHKPVQLIQIPE
ncbi:hypothetical protein HQ45_09065 [Porphyromonas crevioricanis]|uniref:LemA family protein n=1 Tax=Porphyromonas crevioricanis TaxID=393921 RepID=UPI00052E0EAB|nr:LemA family protein [Porphyromonas crevioricanis]KGN88824.1 hypothetical protein HQ45_09065 [Porphyromonas crevioricanis]